MASEEELFEMVNTYASLYNVSAQTQLHTLEPTVKSLFELVKEGDIEGVRQHILENSDLDINTVDHTGQFPLQIAVRNQDEEMVQYLLTLPEVKMKDALLHAIKLGNIKLTELLLHWKEQEKSGEEEETFESADFPSHMEPMMLACICNKYEIILLMLQKEYKLEIPMGDSKDKTAIKSRKNERLKKLSGETLEAGKARIDGFTAFSSSVYICLTSPDPILTAFFLSHKADKLAFDDPNFRQEYNMISKKCRQFAVDLLDECRTSEEVELLLRQDHDDKTSVQPGGQYPRLRMAIEWEIKEFITHKNCQQVMQNMWTQYHPDIMRMSFVTKLLYFTPQMIALPFVYLAYFLYPCANIYSYWKAPMNKFMGDMVMFFTFLSILFYDIYTQSTSLVEQRVPDMNISDLLVVVFVLGYIWEQIRITAKQGLRSYRKDWWLAYMGFMNFSFVMAGIGRIASVIKSGIEGDQYENEERIFWPSEDPMLISEGFYCIGVILAFARILYIFQISQVLGPIQLSLSQMINDVLEMLFIFLVFLFAFALGLTRLYYFYNGMSRVENGNLEVQPQNFVDFQETFKTLFWDLFGYGDPENADVVVSNTCPPPNVDVQCFNTSEHNFTEAVGFTIYGVYHIVAIIILLNMLIALMSNTLSRIQENSDIEWKFARSRLWMTYFERRRVLPTPLSIIPSPWSIYQFVLWLKARWHDKVGAAKFTLADCWYFVRDEEVQHKHEIKTKYGPLQRRLVARYLSQLEDEAEAETLTNEDLEQTKQDLLKEMVRLTSGAGRKFSRLDSVRC